MTERETQRSPGPERRGTFEEHRIGVAELPTPARAPDDPAERDRERERFALLYEVGKKVLSASSLDDLNQRVLSLVFDCLQAERGVLLLRDTGSRELRPCAAFHRDLGALDPDDIPVPSSILDDVVEHQVGMLTSDAVHDPRFESRKSVRRAQIRSALCAPLWDGESVLGAIYLDSRIRTYAFSREDLVLLNAIANQIAIRLKQEDLYHALAEERIVRSNLERYHSPDVAEAILSRAKSDGHPDLGLEEREVSILFADLKGFTPLAESQSPAVVADFLKGYYELVNRAIFEHGGTVNEYIGDSVMGIFGAPVAHEDHAPRAVSAALDLMRRLGETESNPAFHREARVAINSGTVVAGAIGSPDRLKYAVIGDAVVVAARLESLSEPNTILIGEATERLLGDDPAREDLGPQQLRGRLQPVRAYRIRV